MQQSASKRNWRKQLLLFVVLAYLVGLVSPAMFPAAPVLAQPLAPQADELVETYDFEDGVQGWWPFGGATVAVTTEEAHSGNQSLKVTGRTANYEGAATNVLNLLQVGATYVISGCTRLVAGQAITETQTEITMKQTIGGTDSYTGIAPTGAKAVTADGWTCVQGTYEYTTEATELTLYVQSNNGEVTPKAEFYIDDVTIVMTQAPPSPAVVTYDFEDGVQGWWPFGGATVAVTTEEAHSGNQSLKVTGRTANYEGAATNVLNLLQVGDTYVISGCTRLVAGQAITETQTEITMKQTVGGTDSYTGIAPTGAKAVTADGWTCVQGTYEYTTEATELTLYVQSDNGEVTPKAEFYIDDITIIKTAEPPAPEVNIVHGFEDGTTQGWAARGSEIVENSIEMAHGGTHSLKTSGRTNTWNGPALDIRDVVTVGVQYDVAVWARLALTETTTDMRVSVELKPAGIPTSTYQTVIGNTPVSPDAWTLFEGKYTLAQEVDFLKIYVESSTSPTVTFYIDDFSFSNTTHPPIQTDIPSVYETYADDFIVGAALETDGIASDRHQQLLLRHFNSVTAGNAMKPESIQPSEGVFTWTNADVVANFARDNGLYVHGHTLLWHQQTADWMFKNDAGEWLTPTVENKQLMLDRLEAHIVAVVNRYKDVVNVWDVVNEVIDASQPDCLRRSRWYELTGSDYISTAFTLARREAPTATLILNDYGETDPAKRQCMYDVVKDFQDQGVPIDGIGMQMHINIQNPTVAAIEETIEMFSDLGEVHITELDMSIYPNDTDTYTTIPPEVLIRQGYRYKDIFEALRRQGADGTENLKSVTFWGLADDATWLSRHPITRINLPLLFDEELQAKWAYWGIIDPSKLPPLIQEQLVSKATPVVDGMTETLWDMLPWVQIGSTGTMTASFQTRWDAAKNLYVIVKVEDETVDAGDKVEVFVDQNNGKTATYEGDDRYYTFPSGTFQGMNFVIITDTHGYVLEAKLPLTATLAPGTRLGFDVRVIDGSDGSVISWNDLTHSQLTSTANFGTLILIDEIKLTTAIKGTPVIDGVADAIWADATEIETDVWVEGTGGATAKVKTLWDENRLYVYAVVSDTLLSKASANTWEQDSIEVFIDQNNAKAASYEADDGQFRINFDNEQSFNGPAASAATLRSATFIIPADQTLLMEGAYIVEAAITLTEVMPQPGVFIGFDFQVNDDADGNGSRDSVAIWNDPTGQSYQNTSRLGVLQFVEPKHVVYLPLIMRAYAP